MCRQGPGCGPPRSTHTGEELPLRSTCKSTRRHELGPRTGRGDTHHGFSRLIRGKQDFTEQRTRVGVQNPCCSVSEPPVACPSLNRGKTSKKGGRECQLQEAGVFSGVPALTRGTRRVQVGRAAPVYRCAPPAGGRSRAPRTRPAQPALPMLGLPRPCFLFHNRQKSPPLDGCVL